jgi:enediyne polyketide synthase
MLERIAAIAARMPGRERHNLACQLGREAVLPAPRTAVDGWLGASGGGASWPVGGEHPDVPGDGPAGARRADPGAREIRVALTAVSADQLAERARRAAGLVDVVRGGPLVSEAGVHVSCGAGGRVVLVFPGWAADSGIATPTAEAATLARSLSVLQWLDELGVQADAAVGHGLGELAGLVWAGSLAAAEAARLAARQAEVRRGLAARRGAMARLTADEATAQALSEACGLVIAAYEGPRSHVLAGPAAGLRKLARQAPAGLSVSVVEAAHALHTPAMAPGTAAWRSVLARVRLGPPRRRLVSTVTARELTPQDDLVALLCAQLTSPVHFGEALQLASDGADLIVVSAGDATLVAAASASGMPVLSAGPQVSAWPVGGPSAVWGEDEATSLAALFAAGALSGTVLLGPGDAEPVDNWRDRPVSRPQPGVAPPPAAAPVPHRFVESITADKDADAGLFAPGLEPAGISG